MTNADHALRTPAALAAWFLTSDGAKCAYAVADALYSQSAVREPPRSGEGEREATDFGRSIATSALIRCDPPMVNMWAAAPDSYPDEALQPHQLPDHAAGQAGVNPTRLYIERKGLECRPTLMAVFHHARHQFTAAASRPPLPGYWACRVGKRKA